MKYFILFFFIFKLSIKAQNKDDFKLNRASIEEIKMTSYKKDSTAKALILEETGHLYIDKENEYDFRTNIYKRVKIFNKSELNRATINIHLYENEKIKYIKAISYNYENGKMIKSHLTKDKIYRKKTSEKWTEVSFALPNVKKGSIIEYSYSIISPYSKLDDWEFQSDIPKVKSDFSASIPGNWHYNIRIKGYQKLTREDSSVKKNCLKVPGMKAGACAEFKYGMDTIPAFKKENYMLSPHNYKSKIIFELISFTDTNGKVKKYTKTWKDADNTLKKYFFDNQTSKKNKLKKKLPQEILRIDNKLDKAKAIYNFLQNRFTWNNRYWTLEKLKIKNIYDEKTGAVDALNLTLFNALKAANINTQIVVLSTRKSEVLTKLHPTTSDFNYLIVKTVIDNESYLLDITDKDLLFGELPFRTLNGDGRALDFKKGGHWEPISPKFSTSSIRKIVLNFDTDLNINGKITEILKGYFALRKRKQYTLGDEEGYIQNLESSYPNLEISNLKIEAKNTNKFITNYDFLIDNIDINRDSNTIKINPFIANKNTKNPFKLKERNYPVNFGYKWSKAYFINIKTPKGYSILKQPKNANISLPNKGGKLLMNVMTNKDGLTIYFKYTLNKAVYNNLEYNYLKEYFNQIIQKQDSFIHYKKTE